MFSDLIVLVQNKKLLLREREGEREVITRAKPLGASGLQSRCGRGVGLGQELRLFIQQNWREGRESGCRWAAPPSHCDPVHELCERLCSYLVVFIFSQYFFFLLKCSGHTGLY